MTAIAITRTDLTAAELRGRRVARRTVPRRGGCWRWRWFSKGWIAPARPRPAAWTARRLRDWVHRYNEEGLAGLRDRKASGRQPKTDRRRNGRSWRALVEKGPDPALHKVVRWRRVDLRDEIERLFGVELHERSVGDVAGQARLSPAVRAPATPQER